MGYKKKQYIGLGLTIAFMVLLLVVILAMMNAIKSNMVEIVQDRYYKVNEATEIRQEMYRLDRDLIQLITNTADEESTVNNSILLEDSQTTKQQIQEKLIKVEVLLNRNKSKRLVNEIKDSFAQYSAMDKEIRELNQSGASNSELQSVYYEGISNRAYLFNKIDEFKVYQESLMNQALKDSNASYDRLLYALVTIVGAAIILISAVMIWTIRGTVGSLNSLTEAIKNVNFKNLTSIPRMRAKTNDEIGEIARAYNAMAATIEKLTAENKKQTDDIQEQNWIESNSAEIIKLYSKHVKVEMLAEQFMDVITPLVGASLGAFYLAQGNARNLQEKRYRKLASYAGQLVGREVFQVGEGLVGQCAKKKQPLLISDIPDDFQLISTGLGEVQPKAILIVPVLMKDDVVAVIELASLVEFTSAQQKLLANIVETLGIGITTILGRMEVERLLLESQAQTEELQAQSEELQSQSEELQAQAEELQTQTEELRMINEQLEDRSRDAELKTEELQSAKEALEAKAQELMQSSKYKSEFLANMSHELRTPLNSILLLSEMLSDETEGSLSEEQREFSRVIHSSGQDLLNLINDILDLSKVEAGKLEVSFEEVYLAEFMERMERNFEQVARKKQLQYSLHVASDVPPIIYTDEQRLQQIIKNLLSNAFKFTEKGTVTLGLHAVEKEELAHYGLSDEACWVKFSVTDSGIGIPFEKQQMIFEAFQQVDGAIMRKYGGTGLGLSITREFSQLLGGVCNVTSEVGVGSTFTVLIPNLPSGKLEGKTETPVLQEIGSAIEKAEEVFSLEAVKPQPKSTTTTLTGKTVVLVDDDHRNIFTLKNALTKEGMHVVTAENGLECLTILQDLSQVDLVLMDIMMPVMDGYETIQRIRNMDSVKDVPIIALTAKAMKGDRDKCLEAGANDYISKPMKWEQLLSAMRVWLS